MSAPKVKLTKRDRALIRLALNALVEQDHATVLDGQRDWALALRSLERKLDQADNEQAAHKVDYRKAARRGLQFAADAASGVERVEIPAATPIPSDGLTSPHLAIPDTDVVPENVAWVRGDVTVHPLPGETGADRMSITLWGQTYDLARTCYACPEQYTVAHRGRDVGYIRLRHSRFTVTYPDPGGRIIYDATYLPHEDAGMFDSDHARGIYLHAALEAIHYACGYVAGGE